MRNKIISNLYDPIPILIIITLTLLSLSEILSASASDKTIKSVIIETIPFNGYASQKISIDKIIDGIRKRAEPFELKINTTKLSQTHFILEVPRSDEGWVLIHYLIDRGLFSITELDDKNDYKTVLDNSHVEKVRIEKKTSINKTIFLLLIQLTGEGNKIYKDLISRNTGRQIYFFLDKVNIGSFMPEKENGEEILAGVFHDETRALRAKTLITGKPYPCLLQVTTVKYY